MHGWRSAEGCDGRRRRLVRLMWPAARVEAEAPPPPAQGPPTSPSSSSVPPSRTTSYPPESAARKQDLVCSPRPVSPDSFIKVRFFVGYSIPLFVNLDNTCHMKYIYTRCPCLGCDMLERLAETCHEVLSSINCLFLGSLLLATANIHANMHVVKWSSFLHDCIEYSELLSNRQCTLEKKNYAYQLPTSLSGKSYSVFNFLTSAVR